MAVCPQCESDLETPLACSSCGALLAPEPHPSPFETFGLPRDYEVDQTALRKHLRRLSRLTHPDFHGREGHERRLLAEQNTALLNAAYQVLANDYTRADWLVRALDGPDEQAERQMPQEFLMEVLEWNEALDEARDSGPGSPARNALEGLERDLRERRATELDGLARRLAPLPAASAPELTDARKSLNALRYLERTLGELEALRLERQTT